MKNFHEFPWLWRLRLLSRNLTVRAAIYCAAALTAALSGVLLAPLVPDRLAEVLGGSAVKDILTILASSMLAVVTFSLSTLISAYGTVAGGAPPRATSLVIEDVRAQSALSTFLGSFIFSVISLVALSTGYYGPKGRVILFFITLALLVTVILTIVKWIGQLSGLSRLGAVVLQVERETEKALAAQSFLFAWTTEGYESDPVAEVGVVLSAETGFIQTVNYRALDKIAAGEKLNIFVDALPGNFVHPNSKLAWSDHDLREDLALSIRACFIVGDRRTFDDDPRFGFIVLSEIASRALSPAINDPGTAIHVLARMVRLVHNALSAEPSRTPQPRGPLKVRRINAEEIFDDAFRAISRDGAGIVEVAVFLQKSLVQIERHAPFAGAARQLSQQALRRSEKAVTQDFDFERIVRASRNL